MWTNENQNQKTINNSGFDKKTIENAEKKLPEIIYIGEKIISLLKGINYVQSGSHNFKIVEVKND